MTKHETFLVYSVVFVALGSLTSLAFADEPKPAEEKKPAAAAAAEPVAQKDQKTLFAEFEKAMNNVVLEGYSTHDAKDAGKTNPDRYEIKSATKLPTGDLWMITARIKYGDKDMTVPMPLEVKWAGNTPVITLDKVAIWGLGTFSARVVIDGERYAGTWTHDTHGGALFGRISKNPDVKAEAKPETPEKK